MEGKENDLPRRLITCNKSSIPRQAGVILRPILPGGPLNLFLVDCQQLGRQWPVQDAPEPPTYLYKKHSLLNKYTAQRERERGRECVCVYSCVCVCLFFPNSFYCSFRHHYSMVMNPWNLPYSYFHTTFHKKILCESFILDNASKNFTKAKKLHLALGKRRVGWGCLKVY